PAFGPCKLLDYELEIGVFIGANEDAQTNELGAGIPIEYARQHVFGLSLVNDWSARDIQKWEYQPLGPFLAKNFATSISPWVVTADALLPYRCNAETRAEGDPQPLDYLLDDGDQTTGGVDITLEVLIQSEQMKERGMEPFRVSQGSFKRMYWTLQQMIAHHTASGCNLQVGDLLASGTVSGPERESRGCLLELTWDGSANDPKPGTARTPIVLPSSEERKFLADGDEVILRGYCEKPGRARIGFGECRGIVLPAHQG
ncbi:MAG: fumarylacetoacetate hydrolase family protein, partial [Planctomycetota bacterium]